MYFICSKKNFEKAENCASEGVGYIVSGMRWQCTRWAVKIVNVQYGAWQGVVVGTIQPTYIPTHTH